MGLGKTITVIAFLAGLRFSKLLNGPVLLGCPASILAQWVREFHLWCPQFRVHLLHSSGSWHGEGHELIRKVGKCKDGILITTYEALRSNVGALSSFKWDYFILDEGHKLRNPDANITIACKQFSTPHRILMTGEPIQNNLTELWSLFDFIFPGKLGTLPAFQKQFSEPIASGGYADATLLQVHTAYQCALILRDIINPYLLRRQKQHVNLSLPNKTEQVLFCQLTESQKESYRAFLSSNECRQIYNGKMNGLFGINILRKICNHPHLLDKQKRKAVHAMDKEQTKELVQMSGKLRVLEQILPLWKKQGHKILVFTQTRQMLNVIEHFVQMNEYNYFRMDGNTSIKSRQPMIHQFNTDKSIFLFLLTTKTGGIGVNLTGADRVLIVDPDWNPSTDAQARERSWRIGQSSDVTIYRLITSGTIEEKIYHRQIWKHFLTSKILTATKQTKSVFRQKGIKELFAFDDKHDQTTTQELFKGATDHIQQSDTSEGATPQKRARSRAQDSEDTDPQPKKKKKRGAETTKDQDESILQDIMGSSLSSVLNHDQLLGWDQQDGAHSKVRVDPKLQVEAQRLAKKQAEKLRQSREQIRSVPLSVPTWTGKRGVAGAPNQQAKPRFGNVSNFKSTLGSKSITNTEQPVITSQSLPQTPVLSQQIIMSAKPKSQLIQDMCLFLISCGGSAKSDVIVKHFKAKIKPDQATLFKKMLCEIAVLKKSTGVWYLKEQFK